MSTKQKATKVRQSTGNVFADLEMKKSEDMLAKAQLAHSICQVITAQRLTQTKAGEMMGLDQPKISALMRGKLKGFSAERLFRCLNDLGQEVEIIIRPVRAGRRADIHVVATM
jgi:predicted XRE-type DNA-binding protein